MEQLFQGDCRKVLNKIPDNTISCVITDPPYNYEFIGRSWNHEEIQRRISRVKDSSTLVKNIPYGSGLAGGVRNERWYERNRENIREYRNWCSEWSQELFRVCKAGAFVAVFSSTRTLAHVQVALEDSGFYARDCLVYRRHSGIPKGLNVEKKLAKENNPNSSDWKGWHTCFRNEWEAIVLVQKPLINNYAETLELNGIGALKTIMPDNSFQSNILEGFSKGRDEKFDVHCTIKPLDLIKKLLETFVPIKSENIILDPFAGSGTTLVAAKELGLGFIGVEIEPNYFEIIKERLRNKDSELKNTSKGEINKTISKKKRNKKKSLKNQPAFW
ncbi:MAG: site-specific DNA-methyltransferase [Acidobacteriota bacterium]|nr:site-specific DNA-methyltransferase [Acidobacteriota bacterium]